MTDRKKVTEAFRNCIMEPKCGDFPWEDCEKFYQNKVEIPMTLAKEAFLILKEQEPVKPKRGVGELIWWNECGSCKTVLRPNDKYCHECGRKIEWE